MVRPTRFELVAFCFGGKRSIQAELRARLNQVYYFAALFVTADDFFAAPSVSDVNLTIISRQ